MRGGAVTPEKPDLGKLLDNSCFPLSSKYDPAWVLENQMGPNVLWLCEWLARDMDLRPEMRVLDMGCGKALSSVFLVREFGVRVWANDLWIDPSENWERIRAANLEGWITPMRAEAHELPYAEGFFDAVVSLDAYHYFGTDDLYLKYFVRFVRRGGQLGIVVPGLMKEFDGPVPPHLLRRQKSGGVFWDPSECFSFHTAAWWRRHWEETGLVKIERADTLEDGWRHWLRHERALDAFGRRHFPSDEEAIEADAGEHIGFVRLLARRKKSPHVEHPPN
jgi:SAM-dependent methyltransferase